MTTSSTQDRPDFELRQQRLRKSVRRDLIFILVGAIACVLVAYVETNASDADVRLHVIQTASNNEVLSTENAYSCAQINSTHTSSKRRIIDAGFILTKPIHSYLARRRDVNDVLALGNSVLLIAPLAYVVYVTLWKGDFRLSFRLIATHLFRSLCGWFTYLPPDSEFLASSWDFPEIFLCLFGKCSITGQENFLTFFSGHVATIVLIANYLYNEKCTRVSICLHCFNWLQVVRLLATRGHYSIDLIIGYVVAVWVSSPAERLGLYYSQGTIQPSLPSMVETFEALIGVSESEVRTNDHSQESRTRKHTDESRNNGWYSIQSETSVKMAIAFLADLAQRNCDDAGWKVNN
ncbi:hypothetical protein ACHAXA_000449 [Cyclostephanos tholiformis]|uniref:AtPDCT1/2 transmembrane domain-containing protein n=1 Tax=Cyclostephanos tholiformis TaxID=382380 RepID=A0ABD3RW05_9STRA